MSTAATSPCREAELANAPAATCFSEIFAVRKYRPTPIAAPEVPFSMNRFATSTVADAGAVRTSWRYLCSAYTRIAAASAMLISAIVSVPRRVEVHPPKLPCVDRL